MGGLRFCGKSSESWFRL